MMTAAAAAKEMQMEQMDVSTTFLHVEVEEEVNMEIPKGMFEEKLPGNVLRLLKALYRLKQSPRMWNMHIDKALSLTSVSTG